MYGTTMGQLRNSVKEMMEMCKTNVPTSKKNQEIYSNTFLVKIGVMTCCFVDCDDLL